MLGVSAVQEAITVTATAPTVNETQQIQTSIEAGLIDDLPIGRTLVATVNLAPGVTNNGVRAIVASANKVYVGGYFLQIDGKARKYLGAFDLSGNLDTTWKPKTDRYVRSLAMLPSSCNDATVFAGGKFRNA